MTTLRRWWARFQHTHLWRAWQRYGDSRGNVLAGGVAYFAFFSIFPAVLLAFTVFGFVLRGHPDLLSQVTAAVDELLPGFVKTPDNPGGVIDVSAPTGAALSLSGLVAVAGLVWAGSGWLGAMRDALRAIFGVSGSPGNAVTTKLRDLGVLVVLGAGVLASAALGVVAGAAATWLAGLVGLGRQGWVLTVVSLLVGVALDGALVMLMLRVLSGVRIPWPALRSAAVFGGLALTALKKFGSLLLAGTVNNPLFASFALVVGLLVWLNLMSRVILVSAAWAANDLDVAAGLDRLTPAQRTKLTEGPEAPRPGAVALGGPTHGQRAADRVTLAAGAVLGATGALAVSGALRGIRSLFRGRD